MDKRKLRIFLLTGLMALFSFLVSGAQPSVKTSVDKNEILIGDQFKLKIEAAFSPEEYKIAWLKIPDSLAHFEIISRSNIDSLYSDSRLTGLIQTFTLTSFDSGKWTLPSFLVSIMPAKADTSYNLFTDSVPLTVSFSTADSTHQLKDIKPIREVERGSLLWYWIGAGILLLALVIFLIWFFRFYKKNKTVVPASKAKSSAFDEAMKELQNLKSYNLSVPDEIKIVHSKIGEILKRYLSRTQKNNYLNKTTDDILILLRDVYPDTNGPAKAAACLRCGDAVKFAKYLPPADESEGCLQSAKEIISDIQQNQKSTPVTVTPKI